MSKKVIEMSKVKDETILSVQGLKKYFPQKKGFFNQKVDYLKAVDGISFGLKKNETLGLVGESGCGKSTTGRTILHVHQPTAGEIIFNGRDISKVEAKEMQKLRKDMQMIFQDPFASLNPRMTVKNVIAEGMNIHGVNDKNYRRDQVAELMETVGLRPESMFRYPHEFSGGQRQRIGVARALALNPELIICDEPVSALDVSIQAQVINLLMDLQEEFGLSYIFIAHDLSVVEQISDRVAVMYLGKIVELTSNEELYENPLHPYTKALLHSVPQPDPARKMAEVQLEGDIPSPVNPPSGCRFRTRCSKAFDNCSEREPEFKEYGDGHYVACHLLN
jgi:oligopeptide/dipeptide ABC transporter ATP-binding protein